jgi:hypothetical protein
MNPGDWISAFKASLIAFVNAILSAAVLFGVQLSGEQIGALLLVVNSGLALFFLALALKEHWPSPTP